MKTCKLDLGFFSGEFPSSLVSLAGFSITRTPTGESYADGSVDHQSERYNAPKRVARALSEGITGAAVLLAAIRYAEEERTGYAAAREAEEHRKAAEAERAAAADKLRTAQIQSAMQKRALGQE